MTALQAGELPEQGPQGVGRADLVVPGGGHDDGTGLGHPSRHEAQEVEGGLVGPVDVLDDEHDRSVRAPQPLDDTLVPNGAFDKAIADYHSEDHCIHRQLDANGKARRGEVLEAAQAENPAITKFDLGNGLRRLVKQSKVRVSPDDNAVLLPAA